MTVAASHPKRGAAHSSSLEDLGPAAAAVQFSVDSFDFAQGGSGSSSDMDWDIPDGGPDEFGGLAGGTADGAGGEQLCFDDYLDFESLSHTGDELTDAMPDSFYFDLAPVDGSASATSPSDDLDELFGCHSPQQLLHQPYHHHHDHTEEQQHHPHFVVAPLPVGTRPSATAGSAATISPALYAAGGGVGGGGGGVLGAGFPSPIPPPARTDSCSAIARGPGEQRNPSTHPAAALGPDAALESISDSDLLRLEDISLKASPTRRLALGPVSQSQPPTPHLHQRRGGARVANEGPATPQPTAQATSKSCRRPATSTTTNFLKAVKSKIQQKAATVRSSKASLSHGCKSAIDLRGAYNHHNITSSSNNMSTVAIDRPISPAASPSKGIKREPPQHLHQMAMTANPPRLPISPPNSATIPQGMASHFGNGMLDDPFGGVPVGQVQGMYRRPGPHTPLDTPIMDDDEKNEMYFSPTSAVSSHEAAHTSKAAWPSSQADSQANFSWANSFAQPDGSLDGAHWWDSTVDVNSQFQAQNARNANFNLALHGEHNQGGDMLYAYAGGQIPVTAAQDMAGIMPGMAPQLNRSSSSPAIHNGAYTHIPPQHHHQMNHQPLGSQTERRPRMPRAPSAGARHLQTPMRRQRPSSRSRARDSSSASPTPQARSRHSSGSSAGVAGGAVIASSVKKRRSFTSNTGNRHHPRTPSGGSSVGLGIDLSSGGGGGFVNFTPSDKNVLMTGVAPSGSSKTKARREKEAQEKRRRMSEAAIKAVRDAGGNIDQLMEEGFQV